jgi:photosystem II stability/assembly factor-like uncharacterized protein
MRQIAWSIGWAATALILASGCHRAVLEGLPEEERKISIADKFYDVKAFDAQRAVVVGYGGKILTTEDGGKTWERRASGTDRALYSVDFVDDQGWITGQDGVVLHSGDGGKTWTRQVGGTTFYLFAVDFVDTQTGWAVGDRATFVHTTDGGRTWTLAKIGGESGLTADEALLAQEPVLYDVQFLDRNIGWVVGEFGNIYHTTDGGESWTQQQESLLGGGLFSVLDLPTLFGVHFIDRENGLAAGLEGRVARTRDGGKIWKFEEFNVTLPILDPLFQPFQFSDTTGWAVGAAGEIAHETEPGKPWVRAPLGREILTWLRGVHFLDKQNGWIVGGYGTILHTTDGGETWFQSFG